jgi:hypothetical protein
VDYATSGGTAEAGQDYKPINDTLTFAPGETSKTFAVPIINDSTDEPDETVNLTLSAAMNSNGTPTNAILTIVDDDEALPLRSVYLPLILKGGGEPQCGPDSYESNNWCEEAYGPLTSGPIYQSWISNCDLDTYKKSDYFYIVISTLNTVNIYLTDIPSGTNYDLYLYSDPDDDPDHWAARSISTGSSETISYSPQATGRYYIRVYSYRGSSTSPYSLQVTYTSRPIPRTKESGGGVYPFPAFFASRDVSPRLRRESGERTPLDLSLQGVLFAPKRSPDYSEIASLRSQ